MADIHTLPTAAMPAPPAPPPRKPLRKRPSKVFRAPAELVDIAQEGYAQLAYLIEVVQETIDTNRCLIENGRVVACVAVLEQALTITNAIGTLLCDSGDIKSAYAYRVRMFGHVVADARRSQP